MSFRMILVVAGMCGCSFLWTLPEVQAGDLIVHDGGTMTVKSGSVLLMNCNNLTIENGGVFTVDGGLVQQRGKLLVQPGGQYDIGFATVEKCYKTFYVIPDAAGKGTVICL